LWAMRRVGHLLDQIRLNGESKELRDEVVELGTRYGIVTPYTSYLVLEPGMEPRDVRISRRKTGAESERSNSAPKALSPDALGGLGATSGGTAVIASKKKAELREAVKVSDADSGSSNSQVRQAAGKTFYLRDGVWTDSEFKDSSKLPTVNLKFAGDEYFTLIGQEPKLADCFALGKSVVVVWKGKVYRVVE